MITSKCEIKDFVRTYKNTILLNIELDGNNLTEDELNRLKLCKNGLKIELSEWRKQRSLDSNAYLWVLLDEIAKALKSTKEDVYREFIKRVGVFEVLPIKENAVDSFITKWSSKGVGWVCENLQRSKLDGYSNIIAYYGTSVYDGKEMSRLIDEVVNEAKKLGIQTLDDLELKNMAEEWAKRYEK